MKIRILFFSQFLSAQLLGQRYNDCPAITSQPKFDSKLLKRIGQVWKMKPSEVLPRDGCEPALTHMHCENFVKFSDSLSVSMDSRRKRHSRYRYSRSSGANKEPRPVSKRCSVIFAETMNNDSICFYDFELDAWKDKKKIDKKGFQVRCEKVQWSKEIEISECDHECNISTAKTCQSQFDSFCPTIRSVRKCNDCNVDSISSPEINSELVEIDIGGRIYIVKKNLLPLKTQDCFENQYFLDEQELTISECKNLMREVQNSQYQIPLSPSYGISTSSFIKTPREKLAFCRDFMFDIWDELRQKEEKIEALQSELEAMRK